MANKPKTRLSELDISMISMVAAGDDPLAKIVLSKAAPGNKNENQNRRASTLSHQQNKEPFTMPKKSDTDVITKDDLPDEVVAYIDALEDEVDRLSKDDGDEDGDAGAADDDAVTPEDVEDGDGEDADADADVEKVLAKADPEVRKIIEKQQADLKKAQTAADEANKVAKAERDERRRRDFVAKAQTMPMISEKPDDLGALLQKVSDLDPKVGEKIEKILATANEQIAKGNLFGEIGKAGTQVTVSASLDAATKEIMQKNADMSYEQAQVQALSENPSLYDESLKEG